MLLGDTLATIFYTRDHLTMTKQLYFRGKYVPPDKNEGFSEIAKVNFVPKFKKENLEALYRMFLLEK